MLNCDKQHNINIITQMIFQLTDILLVAVHIGESEPVSILIHIEGDVKVKHGHIGSGYVSRSFNDSHSKNY